jgi:tRNA dimethylallyltransferase
MASKPHPAIVIVGPTASGKTELAEKLASLFDGEIVTCDAYQVYRGMDIGTAKATIEARGRTAHHLLDLRDPGDDFSAGDYQRLGREVLQEIRGRSRLPLIVGGTGLYLRALLEGLFEGPGRSEEIRDRLRRAVERRGAPSLHRALERADPEIARRIHPSDRSRIVRAYEVYLLTGKTMTWWQEQPRDRLTGFCWLKLGISWPREMLYQRIDARVDAMFALGLVEEVARLIQTFPSGSHAFRAIGYRQVRDFLVGSKSLEEAKEETKRESRRYAKRQLTWFRSDPEIEWLDAVPGTDSLVRTAGERISTFLQCRSN